jgi:hypothetical protein
MIFSHVKGSLMNRQLGCCAVAVVLVTALTNAKEVRAALLLNYQFETVEGTAGVDQTTPDSSGTFTSVAGSVNAVIGHGTQIPGTNFPNLIAGPVRNTAAGVQSRNPNSAMSFPGNPATGNITTSVERVEIADASAGALDAAFTNFTVSMWLNPSSTDRDRYVAGKMGGSGQRGWQFVSPAGTTNLNLDYFDAAGGSDRTLSLTNALNLGEWTHLIYVFDGVNQTEQIYLNNVLQSPSISGGLTGVPGTLNSSNSAAFRVGHRGATGNTIGSWAGGIDDVMIFNESLAFTPTGSATGTGSLLAVAVPEPSTAAIGCIAMCSAAVLAGNRSRRGHVRVTQGV